MFGHNKRQSHPSTPPVDDALLERLRRIETKLRSAAGRGLHAFGGEYHGFQLLPPLAEEQVVAFEQRYEVELPPEYRAFITILGNGGAGPDYGLFPLAEALHHEWRGPVADDFLRTSYPHTDVYDPDRDPAERAFYAALSARNLSGEEWDEEDRRHIAQQTAGTLLVSDGGCGMWKYLVVTGPTRGELWIDGTSAGQGIRPLRLGFLDWYEGWLDRVLAGGDGTNRD